MLLSEKPSWNIIGGLCPGSPITMEERTTPLLAQRSRRCLTLWGSRSRLFPWHHTDGQKSMQSNSQRSASLHIGALLAALIISCGIDRAALAGEATDVAALQKAVLDGKGIAVTLDLSRCQAHDSGQAGPPLRGAQHFDAFLILGDGTIAFSTMHFTLRPDKTPLDEFMSFRVHPDGTVEVRTSFLNPVTFTVFQEAAFDCDIGKSVTFHW
jgi:hypothetical protein